MMRVWTFLRERYFTVDARTLGLFRIAFGLHLIANLHDRTQGVDALAFYTNVGVLPNHFALFAPMGEHIWSLLFPFSTPGEVQVAFVFILAVYIAYTIGYRTKLAQILVVMCQVSLANRNLILQNGGIVITTVVAVWTTMLPLGARFSVDALRASLACARERSAAELADRAAMRVAPRRFVRVAYFGILLNYGFVYYFNCVHKRGSTWRDGSAVHWVLWQNRINTIWAAWLRMHEPRWLSPVATWGTLVLEGMLPILILSPIAQKWTRRAAIAGIFMLHGGISLMMTLGPFSYTMMCFSLLLVSEHDWNLLARLRARVHECWQFRFDPRVPSELHKARALARIDVLGALRFVDVRDEGLRAERDGEPRLLIDEPSPWCDAPARKFFARCRAACAQVFGAIMFAVMLIQVGADNWAIPDRYRIKDRPMAVRQLVDVLRIPQGWSMFSPDAPREDGTLVVDAVLSDGRHLDPRTQAPPDFEAALHGPWFDDQQWCDWDLRMSFDGNRHLYPGFRDYIARLDHLVGWRQAASIRSFDVYWVSNSSPPPGSTQPFNIRRKLLFSGLGEPARL